MALVKYDPWRTLGQMNQLLDDVFQTPEMSQQGNGYWGDWKPAVDVKEQDDRFVITADLPGVQKDDIDISWENNILYIKGKREHETVEKGDNFSRVERTMGGFQRSFSLPLTADCDNIVARSRNGVLEIEIPKQKQALPKKIQVTIDGE